MELFKVEHIILAVITHRAFTDGESLANSSGEERLLRNLFARYDDVKRDTRPVEDSTTAVQVSFSLVLAQIVSLSEQESTLTSHVWLHMRWTDIFLKWNPEEYNNVSRINISPSKIWVPDLVLYNSVDKNGMHLPMSDKLLIFSNGTVAWFPPAILQSSCSIKCDDFPFDVQHCFLRFGSWTHSGSYLNMSLSVDFETIGSEYIENSEWTLMKFSYERRESPYDCCGEVPFVDIACHMELQRKPGFYVYMILMPTLLLSFTILIIFWIPPERPDRTTLGMSVFSAFFLLILAIIDKAPPSGETKLGIYCGLNILAAGLASGITVFLIHVNQRNTIVPALLRALFATHQPSCESKSSLCMKIRGGLDTAADDQGRSLELTKSNRPAKPTSYADEWKIIARKINLMFFILYIILFVLAVAFIFPKLRVNN